MELPGEMLDDHAIGRQRQVRAVLFDGCHRQQHGRAAIDAMKVTAGKFLPDHMSSLGLMVES
jgi:hypothetical protein